MQKTPLTFSLDIVDFNDLGKTGLKSHVTEIAQKHNSSVTDMNYESPASGYEVTFSCPDEKSAFDLVDELFGPEDDSRDSNRFFVYNEE